MSLGQGLDTPSGAPLQSGSCGETALHFIWFLKLNQKGTIQGLLDQEFSSQVTLKSSYDPEVTEIKNLV